MNGRTQLIIGLTVVALGVGFVALGLFEDEARVRQVADIVGAPEAHQEGTFTLIGIPQPEALATGPNPERINETRSVVAWEQAGTTYHSTHILAASQNGPEISWSYTNRTQEPGKPATAVESGFNWTSQGTLFLIQGFPDSNGDTPWVWGVYNGVIRDPVQPKPSQFEGRLTQTVGSATLPAGAWVYDISEFTAGCSSKFLPDDHEASE